MAIPYNACVLRGYTGTDMSYGVIKAIAEVIQGYTMVVYYRDDIL